MGNTQVANHENNGNSDILIIVKNVPKKNVPKVVKKVVKDIKKHNPNAGVSVITGPSHKMRKLQRGSSNQPKISNKPNGGKK